MKISKPYSSFFFANELIKNRKFLDAIKVYDDVINRNINQIDEGIKFGFTAFAYLKEAFGSKRKEDIEYVEQYYLSEANIKIFTSEYIELIACCLGIEINESNPFFIRLDNSKLSIQKKQASDEDFSINANSKTIDSSLTLEEENIDKLRIYYFSEKLHWGQFKNSSIEQIFYKSPRYILWCIITLDHFAIQPYIFLLSKMKSEPLYLKALEIIFFKTMIIEKWPKKPETPNEEPYRYSDYDTFRDAFDGDIDAWRQFND